MENRYRYFLPSILNWLPMHCFSCVWLFRSYGLQPTRLPCSWNSPGKNTGVGCHALLQGILPVQWLNPNHWRLQYSRWILYCRATGEAVNCLSPLNNSGPVSPHRMSSLPDQLESQPRTGQPVHSTLRWRGQEPQCEVPRLDSAHFWGICTKRSKRTF